MAVVPYLTFTDEAQQALDTYVEAFGAEVLGLTRFSEAGIPVPPGTENRIIQVVLSFAGGTVRMSDSFGDGTLGNGDRTAVAVEAPEDAIRRAFDLLAADGTVVNALQETFFSPAYGSVVDRFGVRWELAATAEK
jgi:PhnB protein